MILQSSGGKVGGDWHPDHTVPGQQRWQSGGTPEDGDSDHTTFNKAKWKNFMALNNVYAEVGEHHPRVRFFKNPHCGNKADR